MTNGILGEGPIAHRWDLFEKAPELVDQRFTDMRNYALQGYNMAMASIQALSNIGQSLGLINRVISVDTEIISEPDISDLTPPTIDMNQFKVDFPLQPSQPTLIDATLETIPSTFPEMIGPGDANPGNLTYVSSLLTALKSKILSDLQNGSTGITPAVEDAIFKRNYERDLLEYDDEQDRIAANWSKGYFPFPNGGLRAAQDKATREFSNKRMDVSRDVMIKSWEIALQNSHFIITQGVAIEGLMIRWAESAATRIFEASKVEIDKQIKSYEARVRGFGEKARIIIEKCKAKIEYNLGIIRMYEASVNAFASKMRAEAERINAVARGYEAQTEVFNSIVNFDVKKVELDLKVIQARIDQALGNAQILIKDKEVELKMYELIQSLKVEMQKAIGMIASQVAAGALSAVHAQVHIGASDSASYNYTPPQEKTGD
jgi:hypothetical protein